MISVKLIDAVILTYNSQNYIKKCINSLKKQIKGRIYVIDNHSKDNTVNILKKTPNINLTINKRNLGFSKGVNIGIKKCEGSYILIINPDTILKDKAIEKLLFCLESSRADIGGGKAYRINGDVHGSYVRKPNMFTLLFDYTNLRKIVPGDIFHKHHYYKLDRPTIKTKEVDVISGAYMLVKKNIFKKIGLFDENFFMYLEDVDFCLRAKAAHYKIIFCPSSRIYHEGGASSRNIDRINHQAWINSRKYYVKKHFSLIANSFIQPILYLDEKLSELWQRIR